MMSKTVAVIGASTNRHKFGNKALRAFAQQGYHVVPIHPRASEVEGHKAYASVLDVPEPIDIVTVYVPPGAGVAIMEQLARLGGVEEIWLNPGADGDAVVARARELGLKTIQACSILAIGESPGRY
jgi:predicted CoA-binding protein